MRTGRRRDGCESGLCWVVTEAPPFAIKAILSSGSGVFQYYIKVVPTTYVFASGTELATCQYSVTDHFKSAHDASKGFVLPGDVPVTKWQHLPPFCSPVLPRLPPRLPPISPWLHATMNARCFFHLRHFPDLCQVYREARASDIFPNFTLRNSGRRFHDGGPRRRRHLPNVAELRKPFTDAELNARDICDIVIRRVWMLVGRSAPRPTRAVGSTTANQRPPRR